MRIHNGTWRETFALELPVEASVSVRVGEAPGGRREFDDLEVEEIALAGKPLERAEVTRRYGAGAWKMIEDAVLSAAEEEAKWQVA